MIIIIMIIMIIIIIIIMIIMIIIRMIIIIIIVLVQGPLHHLHVYSCLVHRLLEVAKEVGNSAGDLEKVEPGYCLK